MLASIKGTVIEKSDFTAVVDCNGFGVELLLTRKAAELCRIDEPVMLYTHLQVSDSGLALFGFADDIERQMFRQMVLVKGIGGKVAVSLLQHLSPSEIVAAVEQNDAKLLTAVPGVGKKTAERICFELADRINKKGLNLLVQSLPSEGELSNLAGASGVLDALESLGFDRASALRAYKAVKSQRGAEIDESEAIMSCLRLLQPGK
ncbi:MAG: Holliday junction branch migration protein RuvA [Pyramidobacter sp.]|jgi:Holliday junction DNA helicase RuvA